MTAPKLDNITQRLSDFSLTLSYKDLPPEVISEAKNGFLDTLGVALVGSREEATQMIWKASANSETKGVATMLGRGALSTPTVAALVNGYAAHALDYDDTQHTVGTHMSAPVIAAALVLAEMHHSSGKDLLTAYVAGFEVGCRLGRAADFGRHLARRGVHATGFLGHFGAAAAAGKLAGLDTLQMRRSFGIVAGHASGLMISFGTMGKAQNAANAAQNAVLSTLLVKQGFTGPEQIFDGEQNIFSIAGHQTDAEELMQGLGEQFEITHNTLKLFACAGWRNPIIEASIALATTHGLQPKDIAKVSVWAHTKQMQLPNYREPTTGLEGKFSAEHAATVGLIDKAGGVDQFTDEHVRDPAVTELRRKVTVELDKGLEPYQIRVMVHTTDGRQLTHFIPIQKGDHRNPTTWDDLVMKFRGNALAVLTPDKVEKLIAMVSQLETLADAGELTQLCRSQ